MPSCRRIKEYNLIVQQKNGDLRLSAYNKKREIESNSGKHYIAEANGNPNYLFRLEVRINGDTLREYFQHLGIEYNPMLFCNEDFLWCLFLDFSTGFYASKQSRVSRLSMFLILLRRVLVNHPMNI